MIAQAAISVFVVVNLLAFTVPMMLRASFYLGEWLDNRSEDRVRAKQ